MDNIKHRRLQEMDHSKFGVVKGESDIRGWDVRNSSGRKIGEVEDLIIDAQERKVRYMVVNLKSNELDLRNHKVLIPIGLAELDKNDDDVILPSVTLEQLRHLPTYDLNILDDTTERMICVALGRDMESQNSDTGANANARVEHGEHTTADEGDFYRHNYFDDDNLYKHRLHESQQASTNRTNDDARGLRLNDTRTTGDQYDNDANSMERERDMDEQRRIDMIRSRRQMYEDRRGHRSDRSDHRGDDYDRRENRDGII